MNFALCQGKKKSDIIFKKEGDQHFNLSEIGNRTKEMSGRTKEERMGMGRRHYFPSPRFVHRVRNLEAICFPFSSCPAGGERSCLNIITEKRAQHSLSVLL